MARIVLADPAVETLGSFLGSGGGSSTINNGRMFITLKPLPALFICLEGERRHPVIVSIPIVMLDGGGADSVRDTRVFLRVNDVITRDKTGAEVIEGTEELALKDITGCLCGGAYRPCADRLGELPAGPPGGILAGEVKREFIEGTALALAGTVGSEEAPLPMGVAGLEERILLGVVVI